MFFCLYGYNSQFYSLYPLFLISALKKRNTASDKCSIELIELTVALEIVLEWKSSTFPFCVCGKFSENPCRESGGAGEQKVWTNKKGVLTFHPIRFQRPKLETTEHRTNLFRPQNQITERDFNFWTPHKAWKTREWEMKGEEKGKTALKEIIYSCRHFNPGIWGSKKGEVDSYGVPPPP